jgi:hypothetical protein
MFESGDTEGDLGKLPSLSMLEEAVKSATNRVLSYLGINTLVKFPEGTKTELSCHEAVENVVEVAVTGELSAALAVNEEDNKILLDDLTQEIKNECSMCNVVDRLNEESFMQLLATLCVFWRTCANLVLYSPQYRKQLSQYPLAHDGLTLLQVLLDRVTSKQQSGNFIFFFNKYEWLLCRTLPLSQMYSNFCVILQRISCDLVYYILQTTVTELCL